MILHLCYNDKSNDLKNQIELLKLDYSNLDIHTYDENHYQEKKKAYKIKGGYSARMTPFILLLDDDKKYLKAFYSEDNSCNINNLKAFLETYESKSN